ncbi:flagellar biosynthesis protein FlhB [Desulforhopalus sp. IMCC35007]|uniref:flagellar biosynthesis protein FlhB n=1 Tax=Desulforhopalus sp. IMCC35007 TaxID=2569543 RepID=UPI0010ADF61F|nr:flagellar biosynthesis protein FlhB [Desulforhopalus sp. IMCC35007]TKB10278.1 flagellar biosynthesis protein FlhB [Desulforhopalus sp. IMCC35007]
MAEESGSGGEKTESPSSKRREDFRKKGQVVQSKEVQTAALFSIVLLFWIFYLPDFWNKITTLLFSLWQSSGQFEITPVSTMSLSAFLLQQLALLMAPLFVLVLIIAIFSSIFQFGWLLTGKPLIPDFSKMNPISGMSRFFSKKSMLEVVKSLLKVILIAFIGYSTVLNNFEEALILVDVSVVSAISYLGRIALIVFAKICALLIFLAFLDFMFLKWEMEEKMKMTKQEVKEEYKEAEGDPHIKAQIRSIQREMARKRMMADVPKADVIVTNPTHISVAIQYDSKKMDAPIILAKGADHIAMRIRELARENDIPIVENPPVARLLHNLEIGEYVPEDLFKAVAEILAHVYSLKGNNF